MDMGSMTTSMPTSTMAMSSQTSMSGMGMGMDGMSMSMSMMDMTFFQSINTPLYSNAWTPNTTGTYAGSCIFLIALATILRGLFAFKHGLELRWANKARQRRFIIVDGERGGPESGPVSSEKTGVLTTHGVDERVRIIEPSSGMLAQSMLHQPWRLSVDLPRAFLVAIIVAIGYLLMLAVMTYNVGYFLSVVSGAFLGELLVGRFHNTAPPLHH